ncbi:hypothetical protein EX011_21540 [Salmonella enterica]|nr:hypothetical protein [Salmonella enterica]EHQ9605685.1 hypothetical protein [Salmonella enterica]EJF7575687.1 hypothetical protein [Salmonella enterica subsp. enterica]HAV7961488.1 hypothetical protein [Escherichia coli]
MTPLSRYNAYVSQLLAAGINLVPFACPCCKEPLKTLPAPEGETWDTFATCPHCEDLFHKVTTGNVVLVGRCPRVI